MSWAAGCSTLVKEEGMGVAVECWWGVGEAG